jgi:hypothetical protein
MASMTDTVSSCEHARLVGHIRYTIDVERTFPSDGKVVSLAQEREIWRLADGLHNHVDLENELAASDRYRAPPARMIWLSQLHADALQSSHPPLFAAQDADGRDQELDENPLMFGFLDLLRQGGHLGSCAAVQDPHVIHAQPLQRAGYIHGCVAAADDGCSGGCPRDEKVLHLVLPLRIVGLVRQIDGSQQIDTRHYSA